MIQFKITKYKKTQIEISFYLGQLTKHTKITVSLQEQFLVLSILYFENASRCGPVILMRRCQRHFPLKAA